MNNKICYVVTDGDYSDYHVVGVFTDKTLAETFKEKSNSSDITEFPLNPSEINGYPLTYSGFCVQMEIDGSTKDINQISLDIVPYGEDVNYRFHPSSDMKFMYFYVAALNKEHAIKIANERRSWMIANNLWFKTKEEWVEWVQKRNNPQKELTLDEKVEEFKTTFTK